jgi:DegV family protein with EDD domain
MTLDQPATTTGAGPANGRAGVRIVTDSSCDLPDAIAARHAISVVPLTIRFGTDEYVDRSELSTAEFWARCASEAQLPETAAPPPGAFETVYRDLIDGGATGIVTISLSGALSATLQSAQLAARNVGEDPSVPDVPIECVDSRTVTLGVGTIAVACAELAASGAGVGHVADLARQLAMRTRVIGALDTLENLKKGGRIGNAQALLASALAIKPIIEVVNGVVEQAGRQRTRSKALALLVERVRSYQGRIEHLSVLHADCSDVDEFVAMVEPFASGPVMVGEIGPVIGTHAGRGTIGVAFHETV